MSGFINTENNCQGYCSNINLRQTFEVPLHDEKCAITTTRIYIYCDCESSKQCI
jgi:hypothetical protein